MWHVAAPSPCRRKPGRASNRQGRVSSASRLFVLIWILEVWICLCLKVKTNISDTFSEDRKCRFKPFHVQLTSFLWKGIFLLFQTGQFLTFEGFLSFYRFVILCIFVNIGIFSVCLSCSCTHVLIKHSNRILVFLHISLYVSKLNTIKDLLDPYMWYKMINYINTDIYMSSCTEKWFILALTLFFHTYTFHVFPHKFFMYERQECLNVREPKCA